MTSQDPPPPPHEDTEFNLLDADFLSRSTEERKLLAQTLCSEILQGKGVTECRAYNLVALIIKHCGNLNDVLEDFDSQELQKLSKNAETDRFRPLQQISEDWPKDVLVRLGLYLPSTSSRTIRTARTAHSNNKDWSIAQLKLNKIFLVKGAQRDASDGKLGRVKLQTIHFEMLAAWRGKGDLLWKSEPPIRLSFNQKFPDGHSYDADGFVILPKPLNPTALDYTQYNDSIPAPHDMSPHHLNPQPAVDRSTASATSNVAAERSSKAPVAAESRPERQLRSMQQDTSLAKPARGENARITREGEGWEQRDQGCSGRESSRPKRKVTTPALSGQGKTLQSKALPAKRAKTNKEASRSALQTEDDDRHIHPGERLLADDCVAHALLSAICVPRSHTPDFKPTPGIQISLQFQEKPHGEALAAISEYMLSIRKHRKLDSPCSDHLYELLEVYYEALSPDCPFQLASTIQYSKHAQWGVFARELISKDSVLYLSGVNIEVAHANSSLKEPSQFSRMEAPCGTVYDLLGPPRILNHACEPNARVKEVTGEHVAITALREIQVEEEITIYYGKNSFGEANKNCSCATHRPLPPDSWTHQRRFWPDRKLLPCPPCLGNEQGRGASERQHDQNTSGPKRPGPCERFYWSAISRLTASQSEHDTLAWFSDPVFIEPTDQAVEVFGKRSDVLLVVTTSDQYKRLVAAKKITTYSLIVDLHHNGRQEEKAELAAFFKELALLPPDATFVVQHPDGNFTVSAQQVLQRFKLTFSGGQPPHFDELSNECNRSPWNLLDNDLRYIIGPRNFPVHGIRRFDALNRAVRSDNAARYGKTGKSVGQSKSFDLADAAGCLGFAIIGEKGTKSSQHLDLWANTLVQPIYGGKAWAVNIEVLNQTKREQFAKHGYVDCHMEKVPLVAGTTIIMMGGMKVLPIHDVEGLEPCMGVGAMFMDEEAPEDLKHLQYTWTRPKTINEHLPRDGPRLLKQLARINDDWKRNYEEVKPSIQAVFGCEHKGKCTKANCPCMKTTEQRLAGCTINCKCNCSGRSSGDA